MDSVKASMKGAVSLTKDGCTYHDPMKLLAGSTLDISPF